MHLGSGGERSSELCLLSVVLPVPVTDGLSAPRKDCSS